MRGARQEQRDRRWGGIFGILFGISVLASLFVSPSTAVTAEDQLKTFDTNLATAAGFANGLAAIFGILFAVYLRAALWPRNPTLATAAAASLLTGTIVIAGSALYSLSAMATLSGIYNAAGATDAERTAAVISAQVVQSFGVGLLGFAIALPLGVVLFSVAIRNSRLLPAWVAYVGMIFGLVVLFGLPAVTLVGFASAAAFAIFLAYVVVLLLWIFASSGYLYRSARKVEVGEPAPA